MVCKSWFGRHCCNYTQVSPHHLISAFPMGYSANFSDFPTQKLFLALKFPAWYICTSLLSYSHLDNNSVCFSCGVPAHFTTTVQHLSPEWKDVYIPQVTLLLSIPPVFCDQGHSTHTRASLWVPYNQKGQNAGVGEEQSYLGDEY